MPLYPVAHSGWAMGASAPPPHWPCLGTSLILVYNKRQNTNHYILKTVLKKHFVYYQLFVQVITITGYSNNDV